MKLDAFKVVRDFEEAVATYTGARYAVAVNSCTNGLFLCLQWFNTSGARRWPNGRDANRAWVEIPRRTYVGVAHAIRNADYAVRFRDQDWSGEYRLEPYPLWDSARRFTRDMYLTRPLAGQPEPFVVTSHHWSKILGIQQGGVILHENSAADTWLRRARFDGRTEGVPPAEDVFDAAGWHCYMSPEVAAEGLVRLSHLPDSNEDLPNDAYPDLSLAPIFK